MDLKNFYCQNLGDQEGCKIICLESSALIPSFPIPGITIRFATLTKRLTKDLNIVGS